MSDASDPHRELDALLAKFHSEMEAFLKLKGRGLLRFESLEDLLQGVHLRAWESRRDFEYRSDREFLAWIHVVAERHIADRHDYWSALKRDTARVVRLTRGEDPTTDLLGAVLPAWSQSGPGTLAARRELMVMAVRALASLPPRDQQLVRYFAEGLDLDDQAQQLGLSYAAVQRAGLRALERFRKAFALIARPHHPT